MVSPALVYYSESRLMQYKHLAPSSDETLERLIAMTNQTNLVALDKVLAAINRHHISYAHAASRCGSIGERICRAVYEVSMCLPAHQRAITIDYKAYT